MNATAQQDQARVKDRDGGGERLCSCLMFGFKHGADHVLVRADENRKWERIARLRGEVA